MVICADVGVAREGAGSYSCGKPGFQHTDPSTATALHAGRRGSLPGIVFGTVHPASHLERVFALLDFEEPSIGAFGSHDLRRCEFT